MVWSRRPIQTAERLRQRRRGRTLGRAAAIVASALLLVSFSLEGATFGQDVPRGGSESRPTQPDAPRGGSESSPTRPDAPRGGSESSPTQSGSESRSTQRGDATARAVPGYRQADRIAVLTVEGVIDEITLVSLERRIADAKEGGYGAVVIDLDTPGGLVGAALDISHLLKNDAPVNTVAWVNPEALSAGTLISLACREIVVHPDAIWGDCAPIWGAPLGVLIEMPPAERAKIESRLRAEVVDAARRHHYDENLVQAFISVGIELWMLENADTGERIFVDDAEYERVFGEEPPQQKASAVPPASGQRRTIVPWLSDLVAPAELYEQEPMSDEEIEETIQRAQTRPPARDPLTADDADEWRLLGQVVASDELLTLKAAESIDYGLAQAIIRNDEELKAYFGAEDLVRWNMSWSEHLVRFLVSTPVRGVLIVIFILGLFLEMAAPGMGIFGALAGTALLILIGAPFIAGMAQWWEIVLILIGIGLIAAEIFVIPGFGVAGISGVLCLLVGVVGTFVSGDVTTVRGQDQLYTGVIATVVSILAAAVGVWILSRYVYEFPLFKRLILTATTEAASGGEESAPILRAMGPAQAESPVAVGDVGVAQTDLRPSGRARFDGRSVDVVTVGGYIMAGAAVRVTSVGRFRIEVEEAEEA